ncbi:2-deoxy-D-gluconate 3-dehydrogenase [Sporobacter termitidis DSM 10068]|uniref:2-deoxy-D-gluconate 3-dehydrogenase n=1 Tax=Sporobacter termitidis DSM 10068 TaxID=1123282 RepID=A0A1M5YRH9_9FIRM|nr:SDR family oxidoreductase [Sporobacter termitidis]SHI14470.1 2-deoxy-D-gluconate 3-dehydrogenase [Sporobacter termitidis DSM 10068]
MSNMESFSLESFSLRDKVAIVTGANQGLGMAFAAALAKAGADLFVPHLTDDVSEVKELVEREGRRVFFSQGDLTDAAYLDKIMPECLRVFGKADILVNNAGAHAFAEFESFRDEDWKKVIDVSLNACYYLGHRAALQMIKQGGGKIINIGSTLSFTADRMCPPYVAAKHAITGLTRSFANELGQYNIQTNGIAPGFFATEVNAELRKDPAFYDRITKRIPAGRWGNPCDLMGLVVFFASHASDYINGWMLGVDGGFLTTL